MGRVLSEAQFIGWHGETASVFAVDPGRVFKVYRVADRPELQMFLPDLFREEMRAYDIAQAHPALVKHVPERMGVEAVDRILDVAGNDVSARYLLPLTIVIARLDGPDTKFAQACLDFPHLRRLRGLFLECGIWVGDASVFAPADADLCQFIDITTTHGAQLHGEMIHRSAQLQG